MFDDKKPGFFDTRFIQFLGGKNTIFALLLLLLIGLTIFIFDLVSFVFNPFTVFLGNVVLPIILATILYYLLRPILRLLEKIKVPRIWGILILFLAVIGLITLLVFLVFPFLKDQTIRFVENFPEVFSQLINNITIWLQTSMFSGIYNSLEADINQWIQEIPSQLAVFFQDTFARVATGISSFIGAITSFVLAIVTVPFILFYLLKDGEKLPQYFLRLLPPRMREETAQVFADIDRQISSYIQGQLLVSAAIGIMVFIGFSIIQMPYAVLLGAIAMVTSVVPYLGPIIAITPAVIIALVQSPFMLLKLAAVWTVVQLVEGKFISPQIMGKTLHIHPITIIFVLVTAGSLFGVPGIILGIPGYTIVKVIVTHFFRLFKMRYNRYEPVVENHYEYLSKTNKVE
ncbi:putative PurR-regulated permease PerM [Chryseomicrobium aureum]|uniref:AI-2E family transporter n=1 Tax=Chryseomicrobium aureum TaxID=1441723 RepID=UPI00195C793A|nr:AI-2E family transporter [Chryseomicrobium aureum]MBM7705636.1 putative PurR-regulated permease PerM [Chryseomicrobium aureum]